MSLKAYRGLAILLPALVSVPLVTACGGGGRAERATQTAARVNDREITVHQINFVLGQQGGLRTAQSDAAVSQALEALIDQELAVQRATDLKIDRDPRVVQQLEAARREVLARAYMDRVGDAATMPSADEIRQYFQDNPALFAERRVYSLQELLIEATPEQVEQLRQWLNASRGLNELVEWLRAQGYKFTVNQAVRGAEQLPLASLKSIAALQDGQAALNPAPNGAQVIVVVGSRLQPVTFEQAAPAIERFLLNERKRALVRDDVAGLRKAAKVEYLGKFAQSAPAAAGAASSVPSQ